MESKLQIPLANQPAALIERPLWAAHHARPAGEWARITAKKYALGDMKEDSVQNAVQRSVEREMSSKPLLEFCASKNKLSPRLSLYAFFC